MTAVTDVVKTYTKDEVRGLLMWYLRDAKTPVSDWGDVAFLASIRDQVETALSSYLGPDDGAVHMRQRLIAGAFPELAERQTLSTSAWLDLFCEQFFGTPRNFDWDGAQFAGTFTSQAVRLTCVAGKGPISLTGGATWLRSSASTNRYVLVGNTVVPDGGTVDVTFQSEHPNDSSRGLNYADGAGTLTVLENPIPGLSASNNAPNFSDVMTTPDPPAGPGLFTVGGATPASPTGYDIEIVLSGQTGAATFRHRANGGPWSAAIATAASYTIPSGPTIHFVDDPGGADPSFIVGDRYSFASPGTPIVQQGVDPETDAALLVRAYTRWPDVEVDNPEEKHVTWAKAASDVVRRARPAQGSRPGVLALAIAGRVNPLAGGVVTAVQTYIDQHEAVGDITEVSAATVVTATPGGQAFVRSANLAAVQAAAQVAWSNYVLGTDIAGVIRLSELDKILVDAGVDDLTGLILNGFPVNIDLSANAVAVPASIISSITWVAT